MRISYITCHELCTVDEKIGIYFSQRTKMMEQMLNVISRYVWGSLDLRVTYLRIYCRKFWKMRNKFDYLCLFQRWFIWFSKNWKRLLGKGSKRAEIQFTENYIRNFSDTSVTNISNSCVFGREKTTIPVWKYYFWRK